MSEDEVFESWWRLWQLASWNRYGEANRRLRPEWATGSKPDMRVAWMARSDIAELSKATEILAAALTPNAQVQPPAALEEK